MVSRRNIWLTAGLAALAAGTAHADASLNPPTLTHENIVVVDPQGDALVADTLEESRDPLVARPHGRWALGVAIGTLLAGLVSLIGFGGVLQTLGLIMKKARRLVGASARLPAKAALQAVHQTKKAIKTTTSWAWGGGLVAFILLIAFLMLDLPWKIGLAAGAFVSVSALRHYKNRKTFGA